MILHFSAQLISRNLSLNGAYIAAGAGCTDPFTGWTTGTKGYVMPADGVLRHLRGRQIDAAGGGVGDITWTIRKLAVSNLGVRDGFASNNYLGQMMWGGDPLGATQPALTALTFTVPKTGTGAGGDDVHEVEVAYGDRIFLWYDCGGQGLNSDWGRPSYSVELTL